MQVAEGREPGTVELILRRLLDRQEIDELVARYGDYCDHRRWDDVVGLFTEDAVFDAEAVYSRTMCGHAELLGFFEGAPSAVAHHPTSLYVEEMDANEARTRMKMLVLFARAAFSVDYGWRVVRTPAGWRIASQTIHLVGKASLNRSPDG